jgi:enamine deaminase RidA (YjgF/YER057c/UK114 family)
MKIGSILVTSALLLGLGPAWADVIRHPIPNSNFPIAQSVEVSGNTTTYYISGQVPPLVNKDADPATPYAYGDTRTQTVGVLNKIKGVLERSRTGHGRRR